jgi:hypothetical protein
LIPAGSRAHDAGINKQAMKSTSFLPEPASASVRGFACLAALCLLAGCGPSPEPEETPAQSEVSPSIPPPDPLATPAPSPQETSSSSLPQTLFVVTAFQAVSNLGTHDFPRGAKVNVLSEEGDEYLVELEGVGVQIGKAYFSETDPAAVPQAAATPAPSPSPAPAEPAAMQEPAADNPDTMAAEDPDTIEIEEETSVTESAPTPSPTETAVPADEQRIAELTESLREVNEKIRSGETQPGENIDALRKKRERLGEELTTYGKP